MLYNHLFFTEVTFMLKVKSHRSGVKSMHFGGTWVAQSVKRMPSAQVMISRSVGLSPQSGSVLTTHSLESARDSGSPSLSSMHF